jgi:hypothetical protein
MSVFLCLRLSSFGLLTCSSLFGLALFFLITEKVLGSSPEPQEWWTWAGNCTACALPVTPLGGIFCANFASSRDGSPSCRQAWHGKCYECLGPGVFPMSVVTDEEDNVWAEQEQRRLRLNTAVDGAHCVIPFQCDKCWVMNLTGRKAVSPRDDQLMMCIRRATLNTLASIY